MTMLSQGILYLQKNSTFTKQYYAGKAIKPHFWEYYYEDSVDLIAKLPRLAAIIYRYKYKDGKLIAPEESFDWAANYSHMLGYEDFGMKEYLRGYLTIHR